MQVLIIELEGKLAHFRKYFANNTAMSYSLPPRSTLMGMIAAIMGLERDSYYTLLDARHLRLGAGIISPLKKSFHRLNYLKIENASQFRGNNDHIQVPVEVLSALHPAREQLCYRLYVAPGEEGQSFERLHQHLLARGGPHYALSFGAAPFAAHLRHWEVQEAGSREADQHPVDIHSAIPADQVEEVIIPPGEGFYRQIEEELLPAEFSAEPLREVSSMNRLLFASDGKPLTVRLRGNFWQAGEHQFCFMQ